MKAFLKQHRLALCLLLAGICVVTTLSGLGALRMDPRSKTVHIGDPTALVYGEDGSKYVIANGSTSILVLNSADEYLSLIHI